MATLISPGVSISVSDESFYAAAGAGSVPLIVIATAQDKKAPDGTTTASYTTSATAGKLYQITSQRELLQTFGNPVFKTSGSTPLHGNEQNEYGLMAAYSFLGIANRAYVLRADIDLNELSASSTAPTKTPANGAYWLDTSLTSWGLKRWSGTAWVLKTVLKPNASETDSGTGFPKTAFGVNGNFAVTYFTNAGATKATVDFYEKVSGVWYNVGSSGWASAQAGSAGDFQFASHLAIPTTKSNAAALGAGDVFLQETASNNGSNIQVKEYSTSTSTFTTESIVMEELSSVVYANTYVTPKLGDLWADGGSTASLTLKRHNGSTTNTVASTTALADGIDVSTHAGKVSINISVNGAANIPVTFTGANVSAVTVDEIVSSVNGTLGATTAVASNIAGKVSITTSDGKDITLAAGNVAGYDSSDINIAVGTTSNFKVLSYEAKSTAITGPAVTGTLWYDNNVTNTNIDILYQNAGTWATYSNDVQFSATAPTLQSDATALATGDLWIDSSDLENFPKIYKRSAAAAWVLVDNKDQVTSDGILFGDFRASKTGSLISTTNGLPNAALYPANMLAWNKMASVGNVKQYDATSTLWKDYSGNKTDGSPYMMRKAQRKVVVTAMQSQLVANQEILNETNRFNMVSAPGYTECLDEMLTLSVNRKDTVFCVADAPMRLSSDATSTQNWATNTVVASENGEDGLVSASSQAAVYYPHGLATNLDGKTIMVPASHMALRTIAFNDSVAFPWFAPAGFQRGTVNNATSTGYLSATTGEFQTVSLSEGQRDSLYSNKINPIGNFPGRGIAVFGQKTLNSVSSALDRINVSRLVIYIREQLDDAVKPFLFEPNDEVTRANAKVVVDRMLAQLVQQRGLFDFVTVCDTTNNTAARIDRNELYIDIAVQPVKAVEFIYIPIRIQNTLGSTA
jgi:hypothetical protein